MSNVGFSSTSATLMWVAEHSSKVNATKRERMEEADARTKQVEDLNLIKEKLATAKRSGDPADIAAAKAEMKAFVAAHGDDENIEDIKEHFALIEKDLGKAVPPGKDPTEGIETPDDKQKKAHADWEAKKNAWDSAIDDNTKSLDNLAQSIGQRDQIEMMRITTLDQAENRFYELGSNKIANDGKTTGALINNIRV